MMTKEEQDDIWAIVTGTSQDKGVLADTNDSGYVMDGIHYSFTTGSWSPKLPAGNQDSFSDWMTTDNKDARGYSTKCECGVDVTYKGAEGTEYWHSHWCPKYKEKPKEEKKW